MTPNHDHATLFVAPPAPQGTETAGKAPSDSGHRAEAMLSLRNPFAVPETAPATTAR